MKWLLICVLFASLESFSQSDTLLTSLSKEIQQKKKYEADKQQKIDERRSQLARTSSHDLDTKFRLQMELCDLYLPYQYDSAFKNIIELQRIAYEMEDSVKIALSRNRLGLILLSSGLFTETLDSLRDVSVNHMPDTIRLGYYLIMSRAYYDLSDYHRDEYFMPRYVSLGSIYLDSALAIVKPGSYEHIYYKSLKNLKNENSHEAYIDLTKLLKDPTLTSHQVAIIASTLSYYYTSRDQPELAIPLLVRASIADIRSATKETLAIYKLSEILYEQGDVAHAYEYIQEAMEEATFYGARQRKVQVGSILSVIAAAQLTSIEEQRRVWLIYSSIITLLTLTVFVFAIITLRQLRKRKAAEKALMESNRIKEEYIGYYFNVNSDYVGKLEAFKKSIEMKLMTKKVDDIRVTIDNLNMKKEREELYTAFDRIFLKLFPDFVTTFNSYFAEEDRIVLKEGQLMNTELRIFALIRMGIHDNEKIARILDYSINTIYNYKARVKSKSLVPNDEFEKRIMEIHAS
jgi:Domain of unknown function (DUF6377)